MLDIGVDVRYRYMMLEVLMLDISIDVRYRYVMLGRDVDVRYR